MLNQMKYIIPIKINSYYNLIAYENYEAYPDNFV